MYAEPTPGPHIGIASNTSRPLQLHIAHVQRVVTSSSKLEKVFAGADLVQMPWTGWKHDTFQAINPLFSAAKETQYTL
jgi:hypothetical protein